MASQVSARLKGDDYQHLWSWYYVLELLQSDKTAAVSLESDSAGSFDDVDLHRDVRSGLVDTYIQIKYHVDHRDVYSVAKLTTSEPGCRSLLKKFFNSWKRITNQNGSRGCELRLLSNWSWSEDDALRSFIDGNDGSIQPKLWSSGPNSNAAKLWSEICTHIEASEAECRAFIQCLRIRVGMDTADELRERVSERMVAAGLKSDEETLLLVVGVVREWIKSGQTRIERSDLDSIIEARRLRADKDEREATIYLSSVKAKNFEIEPDYHIDLRSAFCGDESVRGHKLREGVAWDDLRVSMHEVEAETARAGVRLIRARGLARLSNWLMFGQVFCAAAGYVIEFDQRGNKWRSDEDTSPNYTLNVIEQKVVGGNSDVIGIGVSISADVSLEALSYLKEAGLALPFVHVTPNSGIGPNSVRNGREAVAVANGVKGIIRDMAREHQAKKVLFFFSGPAGCACFIGHHLNAMNAQVQIMEHLSPGYDPSYLFS